jgi:hypothetical protein
MRMRRGRSRPGCYHQLVLEGEQILRALSRLAEILREQAVEGEICLLGGTVMVLAFAARPSTKDVDAIFRPTEAIRRAAAVVQVEQDLPESWLNDGAKGFISARHEVVAGDLPQFPGLRLVAPTPEYMLAMKSMASRIGYADADPSDVADMRWLVERLGLRTPREALEIVRAFYPEDQIPPRARYLLEELFHEGAP